MNCEDDRKKFKNFIRGGVGGYGSSKMVNSSFCSFPHMACYFVLSVVLLAESVIYHIAFAID